MSRHADVRLASRVEFILDEFGYGYAANGITERDLYGWDRREEEFEVLVDAMEMLVHEGLIVEADPVEAWPGGFKYRAWRKK